MNDKLHKAFSIAAISASMLIAVSMVMSPTADPRVLSAEKDREKPGYVTTNHAGTSSKRQFY